MPTWRSSAARNSSFSCRAVSSETNRVPRISVTWIACSAVTTEVTDRGLRRGTSSPTTVSKAGSSGTGDGTNPTGDESSPVVNMPPKWLNKISERSPAATPRCAGGNSRRESPSSTTVHTCVHQPTERGSMMSSRPWSSTSRVTRCGPHGSVARTACASADIRASRSVPP